MILPDYYEFCCRVKIVAGHDALEKIPALLADMGSKKPLIITDKGVAAAGLVDIVVNALKDGIAIGGIADNVPPDSDLRVVNQLAGLYRDNGCDAIIAVGGGSVMDTAKGVNIVVSENATDLMAFSGAGALKRRLKPLVAVPTTAGTGSEVTLVAVIKDHEKHLKMAFTSYFLLPNVSILDSRMTMTMPPFITAMTGMDALSHAVEGYYCLQKNPLSDAHSLAAVNMIFKYLPAVTKNPSDKDGRLAMAIAACLAGISFSNSMVGLVHNLGHATGAVCGAPHGICMATILPYGLEYNMHKREEIIAELLLPMAGEAVYLKTPKQERAQKVASLIREMNQELNALTGGRHPRCLQEIKDRDGKPLVPREILPEIAKAALSDGASIYNPEDTDYEDNLMVLEAAWEGKPLDRSKVKKG
ncbi:MAG TPA: iron-containing alcohol dehydrogenase [Smithella sp.]|nr:iron-containing alcohol dehydrogenase [Smithella sp.]MDM7986513.1 iron-containing alcohol dehydrogenase [Smithella sp.]HNY50496.1 iron-containing alcohol dehydrogenase [Smithella sp.]HOG90176.1 iron-containing alcohol dehydrogenase [Smithella sp.]HOU50762.1 iron-containing alcohol dehydrogenase [Smithella sp.]